MKTFGILVMGAVGFYIFMTNFLIIKMLDEWTKPELRFEDVLVALF